MLQSLCQNKSSMMTYYYCNGRSLVGGLSPVPCGIFYSCGPVTVSGMHQQPFRLVLLGILLGLYQEKR
jgi:hypothetical protein